ncbi:DUF4143 domain-containing protein [Candidatus Palauibacter sp.]|uniref:DUF4143 domain-containing protein n=1 Tax=Candidatus Palauibacter sp. TaxID=3101350 RepID=UPI003B0133C1
MPPWHGNRLRRLVKTPKLHLGDQGVAAVLLGVGPQEVSADRSLLGQLLETVAGSHGDVGSEVETR